ncbi:MAG: hypothetical protein J6W18_04230 [Bacteroidaceae bacterium]|nr:hypothetical protein [Bacteroidaceae bacterium]
MMDSFLVCMYWTVQVDPIAIVALVFLLAVIALVGFLKSRWKEENTASIFSKINYYEMKSDDAHQDTGEEKNAKDYKGLFEDFRHSRLYTEIVVALASDDIIQEQNLTDLKKVLYEFFIEFRLYLYEIGPKLSDTDIDLCILTLAGIKQKHMNKLIGISPSGIRLKKHRMKEKLPGRIYRNVFRVEHCIY